MTRATPALDVNALYRRFGPMCLRRAQRFLGPHEAEEVLQDTFVRLLADPGLMRHDQAPAAWLHRVVTRACIDRLRGTKRYAQMLERRSVAPFDDHDPGTLAEARAFLGALWSKLDAELVHIGVLYYLDGLTTAAIGQDLGVSDRTIANRLKELARAAAALTESSP